MALSPMMKQYMEIKEAHQDCILFFRVGDFYEMFFDDAKLASRELELTLTGKSCGLEERAPMCGVPFHSADTYVARLVEKGYKVAICEQTEDPETAKGLVEREVIQIITPGTITNGAMLEDDENNYLASCYIDSRGTGFCYCDVSTGEIYVTEFSGLSRNEALDNEIMRIRAREILLNEKGDIYYDPQRPEAMADTYLTRLPEEQYTLPAARKAVLRQFRAEDPEELSLGGKRHAIIAAGVLLGYLEQTQKHSMDQLIVLHTYELGNHMTLDRATIANLELTETIFDRRLQGSLLGVLDHTHTAMGARKLKKWLREPLNSLPEIQDRLDAVEELMDDPILRNNITEGLKVVYDFERLSTRIACGNANGKDMIALRNSLYALPEIKFDLLDREAPLLKELGDKIDTCDKVYSLIDEAIVEDPPFTVKEGGLIKPGYAQALDEIKDSIKDAKAWIAGLEAVEREKTGISNLKVGYNKVFGYYLEITRSQYDKIPEHYIRKQTLVNAERFIIPELKEKEDLVMNAETRINKMEYELFQEIRETIKGYIAKIQTTAQCISTLDVLASFADVSEKNDYRKPEMNEGDSILIERGRHPVIEQMLRNGTFVSNDVLLDRDARSLLLITGPNMAGKSTYMRQTAVIVLMAQAGCFVPCERAVIGIVDRIFTRIGAADNLSQGKSTFFVEMSELAYILEMATEKSLILLDEIGRGTSTYDGLSIAWAVCEYLCSPERKIRTMFASHYHELTDLDKKLPGLTNLNVDVSEENGEIVFLHKIVEGSASKSYGIQVAKLAGVPKELLENATQKLNEMETREEEMYGDQGHQISFFR
ncbi:MAG: DNA mismatch repair protein MutS [Clostridiales bacterium]|nr:DNA mismatch repair protein MutS [Clostridiales bacterium]